MTDCSCTNFPASLGNVTFGASVGIGTTNPAYSLDVAGTARAMTLAATDHVALTTGLFPRVQSDVANTPLFVGASNSTSGNVLIVGKNDFSVGSNYLLTVANNGNVGVGTTGPTQKLHIEGGSLYINGGDILVSGDVTTGVGAFYATTTKVADSGGCYYAS